MIVHTEEKGSDVNLAAHFMGDAFKNKVDIAIMITNDTDLVTPLKIVSEELNETPPAHAGGVSLYVQHWNITQKYNRFIL